MSLPSNNTSQPSRPSLPPPQPKSKSKSIPFENRNPDSRVHEYPEENPAVVIDPAILGDSPMTQPAKVPVERPRQNSVTSHDSGVAGLGGASGLRVVLADGGYHASGISSGPPGPATHVNNSTTSSRSPPRDNGIRADPTSPFSITGPAAENQVFTMLGANGKIVNIPPPAHPHLRPGDTITDAATPHIHGCPYCDKVYVGQHARSICRRHQMSKHGIELDVQVKKSRWDNSRYPVERFLVDHR